MGDNGSFGGTGHEEGTVDGEAAGCATYGADAHRPVKSACKRKEGKASADEPGPETPMTPIPPVRPSPPWTPAVTPLPTTPQLLAAGVPFGFTVLPSPHTPMIPSSPRTAWVTELGNPDPGGKPVCQMLRAAASA
jgi:hypothetical protein